MKGKKAAADKGQRPLTSFFYTQGKGKLHSKPAAAEPGNAVAERVPDARAEVILLDESPDRSHGRTSAFFSQPAQAETLPRPAKRQRLGATVSDAAMAVEDTIDDRPQSMNVDDEAGVGTDVHASGDKVQRGIRIPKRSQKRHERFQVETSFQTDPRAAAGHPARSPGTNPLPLAEQACERHRRQQESWCRRRCTETHSTGAAGH